MDKRNIFDKSETPDPSTPLEKPLEVRPDLDQVDEPYNSHKGHGGGKRGTIGPEPTVVFADLASARPVRYIVLNLILVALAVPLATILYFLTADFYRIYAPGLTGIPPAPTPAPAQVYQPTEPVLPRHDSQATATYEELK